MSGLIRIFGTNGNDVITSSVNFDVIYAYAGDDIINVQGLSHQVYGGAGRDIINFSARGGTFDGGADNDIIEFTGIANRYPTTVGINLQANGSFSSIAATAWSVSGTLISIETVRGTPFADQLISGVNTRQLSGGVGDDTLIGSGNGSQIVLTGDDGNDLITIANQIVQGSVSPSINGNDGTDTVSFSGLSVAVSGGVNVNLALENYFSFDGTLDNGIRAVEHVTGSANADIIYGASGANSLSGGAGDDLLNGGGSGASTVDTLTGGSGTDFFELFRQTYIDRVLVTDYRVGDGDVIDLTNLGYFRSGPSTISLAFSQGAQGLVIEDSGRVLFNITLAGLSLADAGSVLFA